MVHLQLEFTNLKMVDKTIYGTLQQLIRTDITLCEAWGLTTITIEVPKEHIIIGLCATSRLRV